MPGSGKSTWGKKLAKAMQYTFVDLDKLIEEFERLSIEEIFNTKGEITSSFYRSLSPYLILHSFTYGNQTIRLYPYLSQGLAAIALLMLSVTVFKNF
jgi:hypothetical protein